MKVCTILTPLGPLRFVFDDVGVRFVLFADEALPEVRFGEEPIADVAPDDAPHTLAVRVRRYFGGILGALDAIPVVAAGSPFQDAAWRAVRRVTAGQVRTYQQLALELGQPTGARAVGRAMATNPTPLLVPCHRVVATDGSVAGYRGGPTRKRWLLAHESGQASLF